MRTLLVVLVALACVVPSFAAYNLRTAREVAIPDFGWGILVSPAANNPGSAYLLWAFPGDELAAGTAWVRAREVASRLRTYAALMGDVAAVGQIKLCKVPGSPDYEIVVEGLVGGEFKPVQLVTIDRRISEAYGASNKAIGTFWLKRLKALTMIPAGAAPSWTVAIPQDLLKALMSNWREWKP